ncbi:glycosyltransferase [Epilithonimonas ginsengisoli]|uniref:Glycosyltransferase n=1 Tax=Epilithonimonas ginsengisoli TaxID=1245592 RepID=A0ABU4JIK2_9FLAO|nr:MULTISPECIES: glycosyltransferase [Chryseobacterium group]MBV6879088.1 glycosyltransferase [Epilithonimonas sp. FP105]MDW8549522.1 glycosyltransferase [Epilithonimonas ginsengisoli]OAH74387.1 hypothetical protein AXA65_06395 [Chryseobacterium sp. FP211-J200]
MEQQPLVSIISGYHNREDFVDDSIQSLINQTYKNTEIIIFDDCSTDKTYDKLVKIASTDTRIRLVRNAENKGFVKSLIAAVESAKGEYIAIHGSGDFSYPTRIEKQVDVLNSRAEIGVVGTFVENITVNEEGEDMALMKNSIDGSATEILKSRNIFTHGEVMFRKALHDEVGGYREFFKFAQDYDLWARLSFKCDFYTIQEFLYKRFLRSDGATVVPEKRLMQIRMTEVIKQNLQLLENGEKDLLEKHSSEAFENIKNISNESLRVILDRIFETTLASADKKNRLVRNTVFTLIRRSKRPMLNYKLIELFFLKSHRNAKDYLTLIENREYVKELVYNSASVFIKGQLPVTYNFLKNVQQRVKKK